MEPPTSCREKEQASNATLQLDVSGFAEMSVLFPLMFLVAAGLASVVLLTRLVATQRAQIGTLLANGVAPRALLAHYLTFGTVIGGIGGVLGAAAGLGLARLVTSVYTSSLDIPDTVVRFHWLTPIVGIAFGVVAGTLAAGAPALRAFRLTPAAAMRGDTPVGPGRRSLVERLVPPLHRLPVRWRMMLRNIGRNRRRSLSTACAVVLALVLVLVSWGMLDTTDILISRQFNRIQHQDAQVYLIASLTSERLQQIASTPGVARAEPVAQLAAGVASSRGQYGTQLVAFSARTTMHDFMTAKGSAPLPASGIFAGSGITKKLHVGVGDAVTITLPAIGATFTTRIEGLVHEPLGTSLYIARPALERALGSRASVLDAPGTGSVMIQYAPGSSATAVRDHLTASSDVAAYVDSRTLYRTIRSALGLFYAFVGMMLVFGALMAFAVMFNTMSINVVERATELATLRASGLDRRRLSHLVAGENLLVTLLAVGPGLLIGIWVAAQFMASFSSDLFDFSLQVRATTLVFTAIAVVAIAALSQWPSLRILDRMDLARVVRERAQ